MQYHLLHNAMIFHQHRMDVELSVADIWLCFDQSASVVMAFTVIRSALHRLKRYSSPLLRVSFGDITNLHAALRLCHHAFLKPEVSWYRPALPPAYSLSPLTSPLGRSSWWMPCRLSEDRLSPDHCTLHIALAVWAEPANSYSWGFTVTSRRTRRGASDTSTEEKGEIMSQREEGKASLKSSCAHWSHVGFIWFLKNFYSNFSFK